MWKLYVMDWCSCLGKIKPKKVKWINNTYLCHKCGNNSLGYDEWDM